MMSAGFQWLLTYLLHSTVLLACAAWLDRRRRLTSHGMSTTLWRIALFGGLISASLQPELRVSLAALQHTVMLSPEHLAPAGGVPALELPPLQADVIDLAPLLVPAWLAIALVGLASLATRLVRIMGETRRMPIADSPALERIARQLALRARIDAPRLRIGSHLATPIVAPGGVICLPAWMLDRYEWPRVKAALAHEMAHVWRHDNAWRIAGRVASIIGWMQPLNRLALRRIDESAELACDAWAADATGLRRELAQSLEDCAARLDPLRPGSALAVGMAANHFTLLERVRNLLEGSRVNTRLQRATRWSIVSLLVLTVAGTFLVISTLDDDVPPRWLAANGLYQSLRNIDQDVHRSRSVVVKSPEQYVYVRVTDDFSLAGQSAPAKQAGTAVIAESRGGVTRSVRYERGKLGELTLTYRVNGQVRLLDAEGERWLERMMPIAAPAFSRS